MSFPRVFITGAGAISSMGNSADENFQNLVAGKTGVKKASLIDSALKEKFPFGEIPLDKDGLKQLIGGTKALNYSRTTLLGIIAAQETIEQAGVTHEDIDGIILGCTVSAMCETDHLYNNTRGIDDGSNFSNSYDIGSTAIEIADYLGGIPFQNTINTACSSSANAILQGAMLLRTGKAKRLLVGGTDSLSKYTINGFNSMMLLSEETCKPFSHKRDGINLGEGAAFLMLETEEMLKGRIPLAELIGFANTNDSFHATSISPDAKGPVLAIQQALQLAEISPEKIDYINAHGTGTENNDAAEAHAIKTIFRDKIPLFSSTKLFTGHTLGAAGALELVFTVKMMENSCVIGDDAFINEDETIGIQPCRSQLNVPINYALSNSFGFGGNCTSLVLKNSLK